MVDLLYGSWILPSASRFLADEPNALKFPKLVQLGEIQSSEADSDGRVQVILSDRFHSVRALMSINEIINDEEQPSKSLWGSVPITCCIGAILSLERGRWVMEENGRDLYLDIQRYRVLDGDETEASIQEMPESLLNETSIRKLLSARQERNQKVSLDDCTVQPGELVLLDTPSQCATATTTINNPLVELLEIVYANPIYDPVVEELSPCPLPQFPSPPSPSIIPYETWP